ncbi:MAG: DegT/DnrJ/EryC1/StrS family aminotransferase [Thermodesulfobacteriota bacterium]
MIKPFYLDLTETEIEDIKEKLGEILKSGNLILGKYTEEFEKEFADYIGTKYATALSTCTSALEVLLTIRGAKGNKIAVPTNTNFATVAAIIKAGGIPVFLDMTHQYFVPSLDILKYTLDKYKDVKGVVWVHIGGVINPDFFEVVDYCKRNNIFLIEDCAHAPGSQYQGIKAGNLADGGAFSFFPTKVMTTMEGGMITTNSEEEAKLAKAYRNQGKLDNFGGFHSYLGNSWRIDELSAYMGIVMLSKLDNMITRRQWAVDTLIPTLEELGIDYVDTSHMDQASQYKFIIKFKNLKTIKEIKDQFREEGIILGGGVYEVPCHLQPVFRELKYDREDVMISEEYCPNHFCPPITSGLTELDVEQIITATKKVLR